METQMDEPQTRILEINLISAQGLKIPPSAMMRRMHTYALAWVNPNAKLCSDLDCVGGENPTWNEKFIFRVSQDFINGDTSAVQFQIYAVGYIRDYLIGTVRYLLSSSHNTPRSGASIGIPAFSALHIRRPSGTVCGILNIAATVHNSSDIASLTGISPAICFRDLMGKNNKINNPSRERSVSRRLGRVGSKKTEQSSEAEPCNLSCEESVCFSDETESTTSTSSSSTTVTAVKDSNVVKSNLLAGKKERKSDGASLFCGLTLQRRSSPSDQNLQRP